jgi:TIR domain
MMRFPESAWDIMADVFISYSRKDKGFVRRLDEALKSRKREAWVDDDLHGISIRILRQGPIKLDPI